MSRPVLYLPSRVVNEAALVEGLRRGEAASFRRLYELFAPRLRRLIERSFLNAALADDAVQSTFMIAFRKIGDFDGRSSLLTWMTRIALRQARHAADRAGPAAPMSPVQEPASNDPSPEEGASLNEASLRLAALIRELPDTKRIALLLFEVEGLSVQEIAEILEEPRGTVLARLSRTRAELREAMTRADRPTRSAPAAVDRGVRR